MGNHCIMVLFKKLALASLAAYALADSPSNSSSGSPSEGSGSNSSSGSPSEGSGSNSDSVSPKTGTIDDVVDEVVDIIDLCKFTECPEGEYCEDGSCYPFDTQPTEAPLLPTEAPKSATDDSFGGIDLCDFTTCAEDEYCEDGSCYPVAKPTEAPAVEPTEAPLFVPTEAPFVPTEAPSPSQKPTEKPKSATDDS